MNALFKFLTFALPREKGKLGRGRLLEVIVIDKKSKEIANEFKTKYIPMAGIFVGACTNKSSSYRAADGVHPTQDGHAIIAYNWIKIS